MISVRTEIGVSRWKMMEPAVWLHVLSYPGLSLKLFWLVR